MRASCPLRSSALVWITAFLARWRAKGELSIITLRQRLWRTVKYEEVYLHHYEDMDEAWAGLGRYFAFYNRARPHQSLDWRTPHEVYFGKRQAPGDSEIACAASTLNPDTSGLDNGE